MGNALSNYNKYLIDNKKSSQPNPTCNIEFYCSNGISVNDIPDIDENNSENCVITFRYIFYPSLFCTMHYKFEYDSPFYRTIEDRYSDKFFIDDYMGENVFRKVAKDIEERLHTNVFLVFAYDKDLVDFEPANILIVANGWSKVSYTVKNGETMIHIYKREKRIVDVTQ